MNIKNLGAAFDDLRRLPAEDPEFERYRRQAFGQIALAFAGALRKGLARQGAESLAPMIEGAAHIEKSKAQLFQDIWVQHELGWKHDGFFVEFGAADGLRHSNSWMLENHFGWRGIVAEPNPEYRESILTNRRCQISLDCVYPVSGETVPFRCHDHGEFSGICTDPEALAKGFRIVQVPTVSLNDLLKRHQAPRTIDYLSIDTEGSELDILQAFDFEAWDIRAISVEHNFKPVREALLELLTSKGYERRFTELSLFDDWYLRRA